MAKGKAMLLMKELPMLGSYGKYEYLLHFSSELGFFIYQGRDGRTMMHRDVVSYKDGVFGTHEGTYGTFLESRIFSSEAIIIPPSEINGRLLDICKDSGILSYLKEFSVAGHSPDHNG